MRNPTLSSILVGLLLTAPACSDTKSSPVADTTPDTTDPADTLEGDVEADVDQDTDTPDTAAPDTAATDTIVPADVAGDTTAPDPRFSFALVDHPAPVDLTTDGLFALFWDYTSTDGDAWLYVVEDKRLELATKVGDPQRNFPTGLADDLTITALHGQPVGAGVYDAAGGWRDLGSLFADGCGLDPELPLMGDVGGAWDISSHNGVVVGSFWDGCSTVAFRWSQIEGSEPDVRLLERLGTSPEGITGGPSNRATVVSDDGLVAAGFAQTPQADRWPAVWDTTTATGVLLDAGEAFPADAPGEILTITPTGDFAAGVWNQSGFIWSRADGVRDIGGLPELLPGEPTYVNALSADGLLAFGASGGGFFGTANAFVWSNDKGMRRLVDIANANGLGISENTILTNVLAASTDASVLIGTSMNALTFEARSFVMKMPRSVYE